MVPLFTTVVFEPERFTVFASVLSTVSRAPEPVTWTTPPTLCCEPAARVRVPPATVRLPERATVEFGPSVQALPAPDWVRLVKPVSALVKVPVPVRLRVLVPRPRAAIAPPTTDPVPRVTVSTLPAASRKRMPPLIVPVLMIVWLPPPKERLPLIVPALVTVPVRRRFTTVAAVCRSWSVLRMSPLMTPVAVLVITVL